MWITIYPEMEYPCPRLVFGVDGGADAFLESAGKARGICCLSRIMRWQPVEKELLAFRKDIRFLFEICVSSRLPFRSKWLTASRQTYGGRNSCHIGKNEWRWCLLVDFVEKEFGMA